MFAGINIRQDTLNNFTWPYWRVYRNEYLKEYIENKESEKDLRFKVVGSDIDMKIVNHSINNFRSMLSQYKIPKSENNFLKNMTNINMMEVAENQIYLGCGDF